MRHTIKGLAILTLIAGAFILTGGETISEREYMPCPSEDYIPTETERACYWDAHTSGNGSGTSFIAYANGEVAYID